MFRPPLTHRLPKIGVSFSSPFNSNAVSKNLLVWTAICGSEAMTSGVDSARQEDVLPAPYKCRSHREFKCGIRKTDMQTLQFVYARKKAFEK